MTNRLPAALQFEYWTPGPRWRNFVSSLHRWYSHSSTSWKFLIWSAIISLFAGAFGGGLLAVGTVGSDIKEIIQDSGANATGVSLIGHVYNIDIPSRSVQISWLIVGCGDLQQQGTSSYGAVNCGSLSESANFYVDGSSEPNGTYDPASIPQIQKTNNSVVYVQALNEFQTTHILEISSWNGLDQQYAYPFDTYFLDTSFIALSSDTNSSLHILNLSPVDSTNNFSPYIQADLPTAIVGKDGNFTSARYMRMQFRRSALTQVFVVTLFSVNWALTGVVLYITVSANDGKEVNESILVLPLSVIVTIPSLRALWVGAPAFGELAPRLMWPISANGGRVPVNVGLSSPKDRELRRRRHRRYTEVEDGSPSDIEWRQSHLLKRAPVLKTPPASA